MDENIPVKQIYPNQKSSIKLIKISKVFKSNKKCPENIMLINKGNNKLHYSLTNKINQRKIFESLKTIQNSPLNDIGNNRLYYTSNKNQNSEKLHKTFDHDKNNSNFQKLIPKETKTIKSNEYLQPDIYNINQVNIDKHLINKTRNEAKTANVKTKIIFNGIGIINSKDSDRHFIQKGLVSNNDNLYSIINNNVKDNDKNNDIYNEITQRITMKSFHNKSKKQMTNNNSQKINQESYCNINNNNADIISGLIDIKDNNKLFEKEKANIIIDKYPKIDVIDKQCFICEKTCSYYINIYSAKCHFHFFCKDCLRIYFENLIDKGIKRMKCPNFKCDFDYEQRILQIVLDKKYLEILFGSICNDEDKKTIIDERIKCNVMSLNTKKKLESKIKKLELYKKNIIQLNSNINLYNIKKYGNEFCPKCHEESLFCLTLSLFNKCLNCGYKCCKYCNKAFTNYHLVINDRRHCKVYYRKHWRFSRNNNNCHQFFIQLIYVIGMYLIMFLSIFILLNKFFSFLLRMNENKINNVNSIVVYIKYCVLYFFSCLFYLISIPILIILIPFFPVLVAFVDGY